MSIHGVKVRETIKRKVKLAPLATEHQEQCAVVHALEAMGLLFFAVPNFRNFHENYRLWNYLQSEGCKSGVPDLVVCEARGLYHGLYIEMKRSKGGSQGENQQRWERELRLRGYAVVTAAGATKAIDAIQAYDKLKGEFVSEH